MKTLRVILCLSTFLSSIKTSSLLGPPDTPSPVLISLNHGMGSYYRGGNYQKSFGTSTFLAKFASLAEESGLRIPNDLESASEILAEIFAERARLLRTIQRHSLVCENRVQSFTSTIASLQQRLSSCAGVDTQNTSITVISPPSPALIRPYPTSYTTQSSNTYTQTVAPTVIEPIAPTVVDSTTSSTGGDVMIGSSIKPDF